MKPYIKHPNAAPVIPGAWSVPIICDAYKFPPVGNAPGGGTIAIIELGGGWVHFDMKKFFNQNGMPIPDLTDISVDGVTNNTHQSPTDDADFEVALDIQIAGTAYFHATGKKANIHIYWGQDIAQCIRRAAADGCSVCSISWGADEAEWGHAALADLEAAAGEATAAGMVIFAAAGDNDSSDGGATPANVDAPGSCPHVISCGGTRKTVDTETVWNNNPGQTDGSGTGGGYSSAFPVQSWQVGAPPAPSRLPGDKDPGTGRMVPDLAANADPDTGYDIVVYAQWAVVGGTSAVAPLYAGLFAAISAKGLGFISPKLWDVANRGCFTDITQGNNGDYDAVVGPDPCTGLGAPVGVKLMELFTQVNQAESESESKSESESAQAPPPSHYWGS